MIKAVVFDLDHTLFDRYGTLSIVSKKIRERFKINPSLSDDEITNTMIEYDRNFVHLGWDRLQYEIINNSNLFLEKIKENEYHEFIMSEFMKVAVPFNFTNNTLQTLKDQGYVLALITNGIPKLQRKKLEMLDLGKYFDYIYIGGEHEFAKPAVEPFYFVAEKLNLKPSEMVYVGDNPVNDIEPSRKAGYTPIFVNTTKTWVTPEIKRPKYQCETVAEIPHIIEKINADK